MVIISAECLEKNEVVALGDQKFVYFKDPIDVWTPRGYRKSPRYLCVDKMPEKSLQKHIDLAKAMNPKQRIITSGEWHQMDWIMQRTNPDLEEDMVTSPYERTSTILDYVHGKRIEKKSGLAYFDGLLMQNPETDDKASFIFDEKRIMKAKDTWEMALPLIGNNPTNMHRVFNRFIDTIYGMKRARNRLWPDTSYIYLPDNPREFINIIRGNFGWRNLDMARACVTGNWGPNDDNAYAASRVVLEE